MIIGNMVQESRSGMWGDLARNTAAAKAEVNNTLEILVGSPKYLFNLTLVGVASTDL